ncbi:Outer membrane protein TolC [Cyclonatronum proteinivorum]|uniref:Outer membrane protein TolC n=1 Tax=Cyclonatronum proteinivorum TaxID=1457365 RepID=A0A345ULM2_9BACT|nr:TolC family protein [Cyclonatronum proteinivorum]AXJ01374.1 Outer membrane protein TolC [Cyclonatronum proteinivorum]
MRVSGLLFVPILLLLFGAPLQLSAQQTLELSLEQALELAAENNRDIAMKRHEQQVAQAQYRQTSAVFLPSVSLEYQAVSTDDPLNVFGFRLKQERVTAPDFDPARLNNPGSYENYAARITVQQPVFNADMMFARRASRSQTEAAGEMLDGTAAMITFQVKQAYYKLVLYGQIQQVIAEAAETAAAYEKQAQNFYNEGMLSREDLLAARVHRLELESRLAKSANEAETAQEKLSLLLGMDAMTRILPTDSLQQQAGFLPDSAAVETPPDNAFVRAAALQAEAAGYMVKSAAYSFVPRLNVFGSFELNDNDPFGFGASAYMIGASLSWNVFSGFQQAGRRAEASARARMARTGLDQFQQQQHTDLRQAARSLEHALNRISLSEEAVAGATENARIRGNRFAEGLERTTDLLLAETRLSESRLQQLEAFFQYNMSAAALELLLGN